MRKILLAVFVAGPILVFIGLLVAAYNWQTPGELVTPAGVARNTSHYIETPGGAQVESARLAIDIWLPETLQPGQRIPVVLEGTRYWREMGLTPIGRIAAMLGAPMPGIQPGRYARYFNAKGYAVAILDVRGTGASSGVHTTEYSPEEIADYNAVLDWLVAQPWASEDVFGIGISYGGTSAELMTTTNHPALRGVAPLFSDFDVQMHLVRPGGVLQPAFTDLWSSLVDAMDRNDVCGVLGTFQGQALGWFECLLARAVISGVKPVEGYDVDAAVAEHDSPDVAQLVRAIPFRDSAYGNSEAQANESLVYARRAEIQASDVPMFIVTGWFDAATTDGALARFASFSNPQEVYVGAFSHGATHDTDPFADPETASEWPDDVLLDRVHEFFQARLQRTPANHQLHYFVQGSRTWHTTDQWPPSHLSNNVWYLDTNEALTSQPSNQRRFTRYLVDYDTGTSTQTRWMTQLGGSDVVYDKRENATAKALRFRTEPFAQAAELTGAVELDLFMTSTVDQAALHTYLDAIAPDGSSIYLTEGVLDLQHRKNTETPAYPTFGPAHSFLSKDASPVPTGQIFRVNTAFFATSARVPEGYRLQLTIAGADKTSFAALPSPDAAATWHIYHGPTTPSSIVVPIAPVEPG